MKNTKRFFLFLLFFSVSFTPFSIHSEKGQDLPPLTKDTQLGYQINFDNVSITEYLNFVSKIANVNFIYKEDEVNFNLTIVSEELTTLGNVMATLVQVLKANGFNLIEQDSNLVIVKEGTASQIATVVSKEAPLEDASPPPIITRVFRIRNANPANLGNIIQPLLSKEAILEVSQETRHLIVTDITQNIRQIEQLFLSLDIPQSGLDIDSYTTSINPPDSLATLAKQIINPISEGNPFILVPQQETGTIFIISTPFLIEKAHTILEDLDSPPSLTRKLSGPITAKNVLIYRIKNKQAQALESAISQIIGNLTQITPNSEGLVDGLKTLKYIRQSHSFLFTGTPEILSEIKTMLSDLDTPQTSLERAMIEGGFYIHQIPYSNEEQISRSLEKFAIQLQSSSVPDQELISSIHSMKWVKENNSLVFTGDQHSINQLKEILHSFDSPDSLKSSLSNEFYIYHPKNIGGTELLQHIQDLYKKLKVSGLEDSAFLSSLNSAQWVLSNKSLIFTGDNASLTRIQSLLGTLDHQSNNSSVYLYKTKYIDPEQLQKNLLQLAASVNPSDPLAEIISNSKYISESETFVFKGPPSAIERIKEFIAPLDTEKAANEQSTHLVYKLQHVSVEKALDNLQDTMKTLTASNISEKALLEGIRNIKAIKSTNSLVLTGSPQVIDKLKQIIEAFDSTKKQMPHSSEIYVYTPYLTTPQELLEVIQHAASGMESSGLTDDQLLNALKSAHLVSNQKALLFTGTPDAIARLKELLPLFDLGKDDRAKISGQTSFVIYKIKHVSGSTLIQYLSNMASDYESAGSKQKDLIQTLEHMRYVKETNSIIFTGSTTSLKEAVDLATKFDIPSLADSAGQRTANGYLIYKPKYIPGEELIKITRDFEQNLANSGVTDRHLSDIVQNLKWMERTSSILISGNDADVEKVHGLLERFDTPGPGTNKEASGIETVSDMSFLIYKLQYHSGEEIQSALKKIGIDLAKSSSKASQNLIDAINAMQWIEITNSVISTGQPDALAKLKELIKNIDVPLKQVFVEVLVVETTFGNSLNFGLRWGGQGNYKDRLSLGTGSFPTNTAHNSDHLLDFNKNLTSIDATTTPQGKFIPFASGFDLGVIGDIILHKGKSYLALGSLINALKVEGDTTIVMNQKIITQDNKLSSVFFGQNVPYTGSFVSNTGGNTNVRTANLEYRDVGVSLSIKPTIGNNDVITLDIDEEISEQVNLGSNSNLTSTPSDSVAGITTSKTSTKTVVSVPDKSFLVLSGQIQSSRARDRSGLPCLGGLPLIGSAFSQNNSRKNTRSLIIFVRPHIVKSFDTYKEITERQEDLHRSQSVAEEFDAALELVKTPDDD